MEQLEVEAHIDGAMTAAVTEWEGSGYTRQQLISRIMVLRTFCAVLDNQLRGGYLWQDRLQARPAQQPLLPGRARIYVSVGLSMNESLALSTYPIYVLYLSFRPSIYLSIYLLTYLSIIFYLSISIYLSIYLYLDPLRVVSTLVL